MTELLVFYGLSTIVVASALCVVFGRQPIYSVLALLTAMFFLAGLFITLGAYFIAALQILLYAGAVLVLFLFVIMLLNLEPDPTEAKRGLRLRGMGIAVAVVFCALLIRALSGGGLPEPLPTADGAVFTVADLGRLMFTTYLLPFELTSFLILAAIVGAITLAQTRKKPR
jgi:NADH-quinone oxidoreductase subunit J